MPAIYDHAYSIAFSVRSRVADGCRVSAPELRAALTRRLRSLTDEELLEACGAPYDTIEDAEPTETNGGRR